MRKFNKTQRNYIIMGLCVILVIMAVGYAAFSSQLKISGTSNISTNFAVKITNIQSKDIVGGALDKADVTTHTDTTATFGTTLQSPGDSITYDITIENQGIIDAVLKTIVKTDTSNSAILFETSGVNEGDPLNAGEVTTMHVKVTYNPAVTSQPTDLNSTLKVELNYEQAGGSIVGSGGDTAADKLRALAVTSGDGLYSDDTESGRYIYKGANPNNYITFNNETWRIMSVEADNSIKIIRNESIGRKIWDKTGGSYGLNNWARPADLNTYLNGEYLNSIATNKDKIKTDATWDIGAVTYGNNDLAGQIAGEKETTWQGSIALPTVSEYLRVNSNTTQCGNLSLNNTNAEACRKINWMYKLMVQCSYSPWLLSAINDASNNVFVVNIASGYVQHLYDHYNDDSLEVFPTLYLTSDTTLTGSGAADDPYVIN